MSGTILGSPRAAEGSGASGPGRYRSERRRPARGGPPAVVRTCPADASTRVPRDAAA